MKKKLLTMILVAALVAAGSLALAMNAHLKGKITAVKGNTITIEVEGSPAGVEVGASVEMDVKGGKAAPKKGMDMLQGC